MTLMGSGYELKPLDDESNKLLVEFYHKLTERRKHCYFCSGGNTCICGSCPEIEYHHPNCLTTLLDMIIYNYRPRNGRERIFKTPNLTLIETEQINWYRKYIEELQSILDNHDIDYPEEGDIT